MLVGSKTVLHKPLDYVTGFDAYDYDPVRHDVFATDLHFACCASRMNRSFLWVMVSECPLGGPFLGGQKPDLSNTFMCFKILYREGSRSKELFTDSCGQYSIFHIVANTFCCEVGKSESLMSWLNVGITVLPRSTSARGQARLRFVPRKKRDS